MNPNKGFKTYVAGMVFSLGFLLLLAMPSGDDYGLVSVVALKIFALLILSLGAYLVEKWQL